MTRTVKLQGTIRGYSAWVVERLMAIKGETLSDVTKYLFDRWIDDNDEYLEKLGLTRDAYRAVEEGRGQLVGFDRKDAG
jgi:hypothetical protein